MKPFRMILLTACLLCCTGLIAVAAPLTQPGLPSQTEVLAQFAEEFDEDTYVARQENGVFTVSMRDGTILTAAVTTGRLPEGARLMVVAVPEGGEAYEWFSSVLKGEGTCRRPYALCFVQNGEQIPFEGELAVRLTVPQGVSVPQIYGVSPQGWADKLAAEERGDQLCFSTRSGVPYYVLADQQSVPQPPPTGDRFPLGWLLTALAAGGVLVVSAACHRSGRKGRRIKEKSPWN